MSAVKESEENFEKSRTFLLSPFVGLTAEVRMQNCETWSLISEMMFPLTSTNSGILTNILSINVADVLLTRVGLSTVGMR